MADRVDISIRWDPPDLDKKLMAYPEVYERAQRELGGGAGALIETGVKEDISDKDLIDTGRMRAAVRWRTLDSRTTLVEAATDHAEYQDVGAGPRREVPGPRRGWWPPKRPIQRWVKRKRIAASWGVPLDTATFLVRRAISRRGLKAHRFMEGGLDRAWLEVERHVDKVMDNVLKGFGFG